MSISVLGSEEIESGEGVGFWDYEAVYVQSEGSRR